MNNEDKSLLIETVVNSVVASLGENRPDKMTLELALLLTEKVKAKAREMGVKAVVAVTDDGANPISIQSMDDAYIASYDIALNKAYTVVALKMPTSALKSLAAPGGSLYGIQFTNGGKIVIFGGGVPLYGKDGSVIGGLGVSGGTEEQDTALGDYGGEIFKSITH